MAIETIRITMAEKNVLEYIRNTGIKPIVNFLKMIGHGGIILYTYGQ